MLKQHSAAIRVCIHILLPREGIETVGFARVGKGHTQAGHEGRVEDHSRALVTGRQVHRRHRPYTLAIQDDVFRSHAIPSGETEREKLKTAANHYLSH